MVFLCVLDVTSRLSDPTNDKTSGCLVFYTFDRFLAKKCIFQVITLASLNFSFFLKLHLCFKNCAFSGEKAFFLQILGGFLEFHLFFTHFRFADCFLPASLAIGVTLPSFRVVLADLSMCI